MNLWLHLYFADFPFEVVSRALPLEEGSETGPNPLVVFEGEGSRAKVVAAAKSASTRGIVPGMSLSSAWGLAAGLTVCLRDRHGEQRALEGIGAWAMQFSSSVTLHPPMGVGLEIGGSLSLFGGLDALVERVRARAAALGFNVSLGIAPTPIAASLLAVVGRASKQCTPVLVATDLGNELEHMPLQALPLAVPELSMRTVETLEKLGVKTLGECEALPRKGLNRRVEGIGQLLDRIYGRVPDPQSPYEPPLEFLTELSLPVPTSSVEALLFAVNRLYQMLAGFLLSRAVGVTKLELTLQHERPHPNSVVHVRLVNPSRDPTHLVALTRERLEQRVLDAEVIGLTLAAHDVSVLAPRNQDLFLAPAAQTAEQDVIELVERLEARLAEHEVHCLASRPDHRPECAWASAPMKASSSSSLVSRYLEDRHRPLWLLAEPVSLELSPESYAFHSLSICSGPERIESGWWDGADVARDYYVARNTSGETLWIFEDRKSPGQWYLHGRFG